MDNLSKLTVHECKMFYGISVDPNNTATPVCSAISGILANTSGRNYHILTVKEGNDANGSSLNTDTDSTVISIGNGFITNYSVYQVRISSR